MDHIHFGILKEDPKENKIQNEVMAKANRIAIYMCLHFVFECAFVRKCNDLHQNFSAL